MGAIDRRGVRQGGQLRQAGPHLLRRALEQPAAAQGEQGVADKGDPVGGVVVADVAQRVAAGVEHLEPCLAQHDQVAVDHDPVRRGPDPLDLGRADHLTARGRLDLGIAAGMVRVPVGVEDMGQGPAQRLQFAKDGGRVRGVDTGGLAGRVVADQKAVVVGQAGELMDGQGHIGAFVASFDTRLATLLRMTISIAIRQTKSS